MYDKGNDLSGPPAYWTLRRIRRQFVVYYTLGGGMKSALGVMSTNKEVVVVLATEALRSHLRELGFDALAEKTTAAPAFFLVDSPFAGASLDEPLYPHQKRAELMKGWFQRAFELELTELGLPPASWPETTDVETFLRFFSVKHHPLIGDLGALPLKSSMVPL